MPVPKPSKMISKRFKKPKAPNSLIKPPPPPPPPTTKTNPSKEQSLCHSKRWQECPQREWRVRVVCTDPDATDDSSADEADSSSMAPKRLIHEICLPLPSSSPNLPHHSSPQDRYTRKQSRESRGSNNPQHHASSSYRDFCKTDAILQDIDALIDINAGIYTGTLCPPSPNNCALILPYAECAAPEEELAARFWSEFMPENGSTFMWDYDVDQRGMWREGKVAEVLNFELDSEALTWINSLQRLP